MSYDDLLVEAENNGLIVKEKFLPLSDGRIKGKRIAIRRDLPTQAKKADVLAEELGHYYTTVGRIIEQNTVSSCKQERTARLWAYNKRIGLAGLIQAYEHHCQNHYEVAEYLGVSEEALVEALEYYRQIYGTGIWFGDYYIRFEPNFSIGNMMAIKKKLCRNPTQFLPRKITL